MSTPEEPSRTRRIAQHLGIMAAVATALGVLTAGLAMPFAAVVSAVASDVSETMEELPAELETQPLAQKTNVLDREGNLIASFYDENRVTVSLDQIAKPMIQAIVAIEDYRFYEHGALDLKGTARALVSNQANNGNVQGGSSITQQMVKLTLVDQADDKAEASAAKERSYARKLRELRYAIAFEQQYSKDWILERYLNIAYFGDGAYGVQAAAKRYFNKNASKLTVREAALLAGLVKNPVGYDPTSFPERAKARRNVVLERMAQLNVIEQKEADELQEKKLGLKIQPAANGCVNSPAAFFCDYVYRYLLEDPALGKTREERKDLLRSGGLTINTTVDLRFQKEADRSVRDRVYATDQALGALAMVEPRTGDVKALAQSRPMGDNKKAGETYLNYLVPQRYGDSGGFQAGSTFKVFVLAAALNQGKISMTQTINSPKSMNIPESQFMDCDDEPYGFGTWPVSNSTDSGSMNMYTGTRLSVNTYYAQLTKSTGLCEPFELAKKMGIELTNPEGKENPAAPERVPSFVLGVANTSPLELAEAYATFAGRGLHCASRPVTSIEDSGGNVLKEYPEDCEQVLSGAVADAVNDVLRGVQEPGGFGHSAGLALPQQSAGKTGTIQENRAVWFAGYTPNLATVSMIAGANSLGHPITLNGKTVGGRRIGSAFGSSTAGPMWIGAMRPIAQWLKDEEFKRPTGSQILGARLSVPSVSGMSMEDALEEVEDAGFVAQRGNQINSNVDQGMAAGTSPGSGSTLSSGDTVYVHPSSGYVPRPTPRRSRENSGDSGDSGDSDNAGRGERGNGGDRGRGGRGGRGDD
ncbi:transglycosylase domain-containing protein [Nocardioides gilvus]|uniref:transglycosylase domain-containing protein n=1 Tax=Nocardioides gilvus TaxID=1735589 RepID=UPI0013A52C86|nr:transglycosylase domain-containing protein [Nocardioides gilvus]